MDSFLQEDDEFHATFTFKRLSTNAKNTVLHNCPQTLSPPVVVAHRRGIQETVSVESGTDAYVNTLVENNVGQVPFCGMLDSVVSNYGSAAIRHAVMNIKEEWRQLDEIYLLRDDAECDSIALPFGFDYKVLENINLDIIESHIDRWCNQYNHPRYPKEAAQKREYLTKLFKLLLSVPKVSLLNSIFTSSALMTAHLFSDINNKTKVSNDTTIFQPEFVVFDEEQTRKRRRPNLEIPALHEATRLTTFPVVYSMGLYSVQSGILQQRLQLLGHHTLEQLRNMLYCVHKQILSSNAWNGVDLTDALNDEIYDGNYFFLNGAFYYDHKCLQSKSLVEATKERLLQLHEITKENVDKSIPKPIITHDSKKKGLTGAAVLASALLERMKDEVIETPSTDMGSATCRASATLFGVTPRLQYRIDGKDFPTTATITDAVLSDLNLKVGEAYLFCHCHSCEHIIVISEIRDYHTTLDGDDLSKFPCVVSKYCGKKRKCQACDALGAAFIVFNDRLADTNPCFLCRVCYQCLHYDASGQLLYDDFLVYPYIHDTT